MRNRLRIARRSFYSFFTTPASVFPLVFLRISFSIFCLLLCISLYPYLHDLYGSEGYIQWVISDNLFKKPLIPTLHNLFDWAQHFGTFTDMQVIRTAYLLYMACIICIGLGLFSNLFALLAWFLHRLFLNTGNIYGYGVETFVHMILFYFIFMPIDSRWSVSSFLRKKKYNSREVRKHHAILSRMSIRLLQLHLCIIYLDAGLAKMFGNHWWNGEAMWRLLTHFQYNTIKLFGLSSYPLFLKIVGWVVLLLETGYAVFIWMSTRKIFLYGILLMHIGISLLMGLYFFGAVMV